jgi:PTH2 family peptidyl-tRNA hydrolase
MEFKQCILVRDDLKLSPGKLAVQVAHAALLAYEQADRDTASSWKREGQKKVVLRGGTVEDLYRLQVEAKRLGIPAAIVVDAGLTELPAGTVTALGLGPAPNKQMDKVTGRLGLL